MSRRLLSLAGAVLVLLQTVLLAGELPLEALVLRQEAEQAFEDGRYEETLRLLADLRKWVKVPANEKLLAANNKSWLAILGNVNALEARAYYELGEREKARTKVRLASAQMQQRRKHFVELRGNALVFWLLEAKLKYLEGDLDRPVPDFGVSDSMGATIEDLAERVGNPKKAAAKYSESERILQGVLKVAPQANDPTLDEVMLDINRLLIRLLVSEAHVRLWHHGRPSRGEIADAESFLVRAEELLANNGWWKLFVAPDAPFPLSYRRFQELAETKRTESSAQGDTVTVETLISLKKEWGQAIDDYLRVMCTRAEAAAYAELTGRGEAAPPSAKRYRIADAEKLYGRCLGLLRQQYRPEHPKVLKARLSQARWYVVISDPELLRDGGSSDTRVRAMVSMARDCLLLVHEQRAYLGHSIANDPKTSLEMDFIESRALNNLVAIHETRPCLTEAQVAEIKVRQEKLVTALAAASSPGKTASANP